jgi:hypothetical protein
MFDIGDKVKIKRGKQISEHMAGVAGMLNHMSSHGVRYTFGTFDNQLSAFNGEELTGTIYIKGYFNSYIIKTQDNKYHAFTNEYNEMELIEDE